PYTEVVGAAGEGHLEHLRLRDVRTGEESTVDVSWLFIFIGAEPRTDWLGDVVARDEDGFVRARPDLLGAGRRPARRGPARGPHPPGVQRARGVRRRRRTLGISEASRVRGRRGRHGRVADPPLSGGAMSTLTPDELRTLFLFESLTDEQLTWLSEHGRVEQFA